MPREVTVPTVAIAHHPDLTFDDAMGVFKTHFSGQYEVYGSTTFGRGQRIVVKKSAWTAVGVGLNQRVGGTSFVFAAFIPSRLSRVPFELIGALIALLFLKRNWNELEAEIQTFIEGEASFK